MQLKNISLKKTAAFCLLMFFALSGKLKAQIIYTDIPDATPSATYPLDLNNDGIDDFLIQFDLADKVMCKPQNNNAYSGDFVAGQHLPWALAASADICDSLATWYDSINPGTMAWGTSTGNWVGATDKYLALKLVVGANTYYGWARLDVMATSTSFTIKDYAYESSPNTCIQAGQTSVGMDENRNQYGFSLFPNPFTYSVTIQPAVHFQNASLLMYNAAGQTVMQLKNLTGASVSISRGNLSPGLYFMRLTEENKIIAEEKLVIID